ncbi:hypothetical protein IWZ00DRAFT_305927 [Phyllosticta capitalensis]
MASYRYGRPEPPVFKHGGFELRDTKFTAGGYDRIDGKDLRKIFSLKIYDPLAPPDWGMLQAMKDNNFEFKKVCFIAQLKHYGIDHYPNAKVADLRNLLGDSVHKGKCDSVPEPVLQFQSQMEKDYEPARQKWLTEFRPWDAKQKEQCVEPQQKADYDFDWFLEFYFMSEGKPDPTKTLEVLELSGHDKKSHRIERTVPGLHTEFCRSSMDIEDQFPAEYGANLLIGWDSLAVTRRAEEREKQLEEKRRQMEEKRGRERDAMWEKALRPHLQYLIQRSKMDLAPPKSFDLQRCIGSYVVRCDDVAREEYFPSTLSLNIFPGVEGSLTANFSLGIVEGTMLLDFSEDMLDHLAVELDEKEKPRTRDPCLRHESPCDDCYECGFGSSEEEEEEEEDDEDEEDEERTLNAAGKRSAPDSNTKANAPPTKRQRTSPELPRRVYFRLRGREAGDETMKYGSEIFSEVQTGYLDFLDDECTQFAGFSDWLPKVGKNTKFNGCKTSDILPKWVEWEPWSDYSAIQAEKSWDSLRLR